MEHIHLENNVSSRRALCRVSDDRRQRRRATRLHGRSPRGAGVARPSTRIMRRLDTHGHWLVFWAATLLVAFFILGFFGREVYRQAPADPGAGRAPRTAPLLITKDDILTGQQVWQSTGGQQLGSIWGHGAYQAPDWSADWLHRECVGAARRLGRARARRRLRRARPPSAQATLRGAAAAARCARTRTIRRRGTVTVSADRARGHRAARPRHYDALFGGDPSLRDAARGLRDAGGRRSPIRRAGRRSPRFFFWTSWACATERPGQHVTYTNNWPHEPLIGNRPTGANILWSIVSVVLLLAGIGALVWWRAFRGGDEPSRRSRRPTRPAPRHRRHPFDAGRRRSTSASSSRCSSCRCCSAR